MKLEPDKIFLRIKKFILPITFMIIGIWTLPVPLYIPTSGLDPSWSIGINAAISNNLQFGPDIAFTYGPLGFLFTPTYTDHNLWLMSVIFVLFVHFLFVFSVALLMLKFSANWKEYIILLPMLIPINYTRNFTLLFSMVIFLYLIILQKIDRKYEKYALFFVSFMFAIASLIKFNMAMASVGIIITFILICLLNKKFKRHLYFLVSYFAFVPILWVISGQNMTNLPVYLFNSYQISYGFNDGMAMTAPVWQTSLALIGLIFIFILFSYSFFKKTNNVFLFILLNAGLLFLIFKHSFVRPGGRVFGFFDIYAIFFILIYVLSKKEMVFELRNFSLLISGIFLISIYLGLPGIIDDNILNKLPEYQSSISLISNKSYQTQVLENSKNRIRLDYPLDNRTIQYIDNKAIDIFPWDIALVWGYGFNWSPRPVFQSYSTYTQYLGRVNAWHFSNGMAPQVILYSYKSIDGRYPIFDEPSTFTSILQNYTLVNRSGEFLLLQYTHGKNKRGIEEDLGTVEVEPGQSVKIPEYDSGDLYARIELEYSTFGKIIKLIYKPAFSHVRFQFSNLTYSNEFRFIPGVSKNGVFLSRYVGNADDLALVFAGNKTQNLNEIIIYTENDLYYKKLIKINFIGIPSN